MVKGFIQVDRWTINPAHIVGIFDNSGGGTSVNIHLVDGTKVTTATLRVQEILKLIDDVLA